MDTEVEELDESRDEAEAPEGSTTTRSSAATAALAQVVKFGDPVLRSEASPVSEFDTARGRDVERM